jgi:hypothetical protein
LSSGQKTVEVKRGGRGIKDLRKMNASLLCKWWWLLENGEGIWQYLIKIKYVKGVPICLIKHTQHDSPVWSDLLKIRPVYLKGRTFKVRDGKMVSFWMDSWLEDKPLCVLYPILFDLCRNPKSSVSEMKENEWVVPFRIILPPIVRDQWYELAGKLNYVNLEGGKDIPIWNWTASRKFSVKSVYLELTKRDAAPSYSEIWKAKIPEKVKIFMWPVAQGSILTKDNMVRRKWQGDPGCYFCGEEECQSLTVHLPGGKSDIWGVIALCFSVQTRPNSYGQYWEWIPLALPGGNKMYMLGLVAVCWAIWKTRNRTCFDKKHIKSPLDIIISTCVFMRYWAGLYSDDSKMAIEEGVDILMKTVVDLLGQKRR